MGQVCSCLNKDGELTQFMSQNGQRNDFSNSKNAMLPGISILDQLEMEERYNMQHNQNSKNFDFYPDEVVILVHRMKLVKLQSIVKGYLLRKKFKTKMKEELVVKNFLENIFVQFNTEELERKESFFPSFDAKGWKKLYDDDSPLFNTDYGLVFSNSLRKNLHNYYMGNMNINDEKHGLGRLINKAGVIYQGHWFHDEFHGWGRMIYPSGVLYEGYFNKGILDGRGIHIDLPSKIKYEGDFRKGIKEGMGKEETEEFIYEGSFIGGHKQGKGIFFYKKTNDFYEGEVSNSLINGHGFYKWENKHSYTGTFKNGLMHGKGTYKWADGGEYIGDYKDNIKEGIGIFKWANGRIYHGPFEGGVPQGKGKLTVNNKTTDVEFDQGKIINAKSKAK